MESSNPDKLQQVDEDSAATKIQSHFRGFSWRLDSSMLVLRHLAAEKIQRNWRSFVERRKLRRVKEYIALFRIGRLVRTFKLKLEAQRMKRKREELDFLLCFHPGKSNGPAAPRKPIRKGRLKKAKGIFELLPPQTPRRATTSLSQKKVVRKNTEEIKPRIDPTRSRSVVGPLIKSTPMRIRRTRRILLELPVPWHNRNAKRLSESQKEEMLFNQRNNVGWAKKELLPMLWNACNRSLDQRDDLSIRNEKFLEKHVSKIFLSLIPRNTMTSSMRSPQDLTFFGSGCMLAVNSYKEVTFVVPQAQKTNQEIKRLRIGSDVAMLDVAVHPFSGAVLAISPHWSLDLYHNEHMIFSLPLEVKDHIPKTRHYICFDDQGLVWVNLLPQQGKLLLVDPLTLQVSVEVDGGKQQELLKHMQSLVPVSAGFRGFAVTTDGLTDVYLFTWDFRFQKTLRHPKAVGRVEVKFLNGRLYVWSENHMLYVWQLGKLMQETHEIAVRKLPAKPTDMAYCNDMLYVSCDDQTIRVFLANPTEYPLRLPESMVKASEKAYEELLLGPVTMTTSRGLLTEMASRKTTATPVKIAAAQFSDRLVFVAALCDNGNVVSLWVTNHLEKVRIFEFDVFDYQDDGCPLLATEFKANAQEAIAKTSSHMEKMEFMDSIDARLNIAIMKNTWNGADNSLIDVLLEKDVSHWYPFLPKKKSKGLSCYEVYHFLMRTGILFERNLTFAQFVGEGKCRQGPYQAIYDMFFSTEQLNKLLASFNPVSWLTENSSAYTLTQSDPNLPGVKATAQKWMSMFERNQLNERLKRITMLEDLAKQQKMDFYMDSIMLELQAQRKQESTPVSPMKLRPHAHAFDLTRIDWTQKPSSNRLIDQKRFKSIYHCWSTVVMTGRDETTQMSLKCMQLPASIFDTYPISQHVEMLAGITGNIKGVSCVVYGFQEIEEGKRSLITSNDTVGVPLSHYLTVHSYLGTNKSVQAMLSIMHEILIVLVRLHKSKFILRTLCPDNVLLNAINSSITIGDISDCQSPELSLPLPPEFSAKDNPFLPPEYFHHKPDEFTTVFDIWQFGMMMLYMTTGFLPKSYGSILPSGVSSMVFYDWLNGCPIIGRGALPMSGRGECFIQGKEATRSGSILDIDNYRLSIGNPKGSSDEGRLLLHIIAACLQMDPQRRPTAEQLLQCRVFESTGQYTATLNQYTMKPNPVVLVSRFFVPLLDQLGNSTFRFFMGMVSSLLFQESPTEADRAYVLRIDTKSSSKVIGVLFQLNFLDRVVKYALDGLSNRITIDDVVPAVSYRDEMCDIMQQFFWRFVQLVERSSEFLPYIEDLTLSLYGMFACNPILRSQQGTYYLASHDSAPAFLYTYNKFHHVCKYTFDNSYYFRKALVKRNDRSDAYFQEFLSFADSVHDLALALCISVDRKRSNAIKNIITIWQNGKKRAINRLFIDFRVPQKIIQGGLAYSSKPDTESFVCSVLKKKAIDSVLHVSVCTPTSILFAMYGLFQCATDSTKLVSVEIIRRLLQSDLPENLSAVCCFGVLGDLLDSCRDMQIRNLITETLERQPQFFIPVAMHSSTLQFELSENHFSIMPELDADQLGFTTFEDIAESSKKCIAYLFAWDCGIFDSNLQCVDLMMDFIVHGFSVALKEEKKRDLLQMNTLCSALLDLFNGLGLYWSHLQPHCAEVISFLLDVVTESDASLTYIWIERIFLRTVELKLSVGKRVLSIWPKLMERDLNRNDLSLSALRKQMYIAMLEYGNWDNAEDYFETVYQHWLYGSDLSLREEAIWMIIFLLRNVDSYPDLANRLCLILMKHDFVEAEKKLLSLVENLPCVKSSMQLLTSVSKYPDLFNDTTMKATNSLLESMQLRFIGVIDLELLKESEPMTTTETRTSIGYRRSVTSLQKEKKSESPAIGIVKPRPLSAFVRRRPL